MGSVLVDPDTALALINDIQWTEDNMTLLRELSFSVENGETYEWTWESDRTVPVGADADE